MSEEVAVLVGDIMTDKVITIRADKPVSEVIKTMNSNDISGIVVVDFVGEVVGIISAIDVFKVFNEVEDTDRDFVAEDIMTPYMVDIQPETPAEEAARIMLKNVINRLVVTESPSRKKPVGLISSTDILRALG